TWPSGCWRPYSATSPFNTPIPENPRLAPSSAAIVSRVVAMGTPTKWAVGQGSNANGADDWAHPTYWPTSGDPLFRIHCTEPWGTCPIEGHQIRIPDRARFAGSSDAHMTVVDQSTGWEY